MRNSKRVLSKAQILDRVWSYDFGGRSNIVELYVSYLRKKIDSGREPMIHTLRGAGYVLKPADADARRRPASGSPRSLVPAGPAAGHPGGRCLRWSVRGSAWRTEIALQRFLMNQLDEQVIDAGRSIG